MLSTSKVCQIWKKMMEIMTQEVQTNDLISRQEIDSEEHWKRQRKAFPIYFSTRNAFFREVKVLKNDKFELEKLMELHREGSSSGNAPGNEAGAKVE
ncbi:ribosomal protein S3a isoform 5-like protein [Camelus ferus]|nr:ribosomal protein S3a isoform 5-like protein [Camelus ferus]